MAPSTSASKDIIELVSGDVPTVDAVTARIYADSCGAVSSFVGRTRSSFEGKRVTTLEYEAYEPMAVKQLAELCEAARSRWNLGDDGRIAIVHKLGPCPVGAPSVVIVASSPHRKESLEVVSWLIDQLKEKVPIWKKEVYEDGSVWKQNAPAANPSAAASSSDAAAGAAPMDLDAPTAPPVALPDASDADWLEVRMKEYENSALDKPELETGKPVIVRLDGHNFSAFVKNFKRPFDKRVHSALCCTAADLMNMFRPVASYIHSDEITLYFSEFTKENFPFGGRTVKLASIMAGYCSVRFAFHLMHQFKFEEHERDALDKLKDPHFHFDCRLHTVPSRMEALYNMLWRQRLDCLRNSIMVLARARWKKQKWNRVPAMEMLRMMYREKGIDWNKEPRAFKFGSILKFEKLVRKEFNPRLEIEVDCIRRRVRKRSIQLREANAEGVEWLFEELWPEGLDTDRAVCEANPRVFLKLDHRKR